ncbi:hypothetical protein ACMYR3_14150 [Ampullimonas aquatilis]|uniref:hypothetical protein n=1 Tax=Ampullimonas aquatilis TaxID=1341549 RepID=UPI003C7616D6
MNLLFAILIVLSILLGLWLDALGPVWSPLLVSAEVTALLVVISWRSSWQVRSSFILCLIIATLGEMMLSLGFGWYDYRLHDIPWFVPPGHVLLYALGDWLSTRLPERGLRMVLPVAVLTTALLWWQGMDQLSVFLMVMYLACVRWGPNPRLYHTMFVLALLLELWGTSLGNWAWRSIVPGVHWSTLNPPFAAGAGYCVLDWLVGWLMTRESLIRLAKARFGSRGNLLD